MADTFVSGEAWDSVQGFLVGVPGVVVYVSTLGDVDLTEFIPPAYGHIGAYTDGWWLGATVVVEAGVAGGWYILGPGGTVAASGTGSAGTVAAPGTGSAASSGVGWSWAARVGTAIERTTWAQDRISNRRSGTACLTQKGQGRAGCDRPLRDGREPRLERGTARPAGGGLQAAVVGQAPRA